LRTIGSELSALATVVLSMPLRPLFAADEFDPRAPHPTPVLLVHGFLGDPTNFLVLRRFLSARGVRNFVSFRYRPGLDVVRLASRLCRAIDAVRASTGAPQVDIVAHNLGGLVARRVVKRYRGVHRLVTLGAPCIGGAIAPQELAVFGDADLLVPVPRVAHGRQGRLVVLPGCGHLGLLYAPAALREVAAHLATPVEDRTLPPAPRPLKAA